MNIYHITIFGINININPVAFKIGSFSVYWYGILIATGFLLAVLYALKNAKKLDLDPDRMLDVVLVSTPVAILFARLYYWLFDSDGSITSISEFFGIGNANGLQGLAIYGGVIGAALSGILMCKIRKVRFSDMVDIAAPGFLIGQSIGRWGNFTNQEAFGSPTGSTWFGMVSENTSNVLVHPCFLYESIWCIAGFFILNYYIHHRKFSGQIALMYGVWYCFGRAFIELLRTDSLMLGKIKVSFLLSIIVFLTSLIFLILNWKKSQLAKDSQYEALFEVENGENNENTDGEE